MMAYIDGYGVVFSADKRTIISYLPFFGGKYVVPEGVTSIDDRAFKDCQRLTSITIPDSVTNIGGEAFAMCTGLTSIQLPSHLQGLSADSFIGCTGFTSPVIYKDIFIKCPTNYEGAYTIPDGIRIIGSEAFDSCNKLTSIKIPDSVTEISYYAFHNCINLKEVNIPSSVTMINVCAFFKCEKLSVVNMQKREEKMFLETGAFVGCKSLHTVVLPQNVEIGNEAFDKSTKIIYED